MSNISNNKLKKILRATSCCAALLFCILSVPTHASEASENVKLNQYLNEILSAKELVTPTCYTCLPSHNSATQFSTDFISFDVKSLCTDENNRCKKVTPKSICSQAEQAILKSDPSGNFPIERNAVKLAKRFASKELRKKIFAFTASTFNGIKTNPDFLNRCCKGDQACLGFIHKTELNLIKGLPVTDLRSPEFKSDPAMPRIEFTEFNLLSCKTDSCIKQSLFHEFGHACQYSRHHFVQELYYCNTSKNLAFNDYISDFGKPVAECFNEKINNNPRVGNASNNCAGMWFTEAYADSLFLDQWKKPSAYQYMCWDNLNTGTKSDHGPFNLQECITNREPVRSSICGNQQKCSP